MASPCYIRFLPKDPTLPPKYLGMFGAFVDDWRQACRLQSLSVAARATHPHLAGYTRDVVLAEVLEDSTEHVRRTR